MTRGFGIVGTGVIAAIHADAIALLSKTGLSKTGLSENRASETGLPDARLVAVTDVDAGAAAAFAAARGCPAEPDLGALLARRDVEVVCVCVPSGLHAAIGVQAAKAGKHLVVEKPIDVSLEAADRLIDAARAAGVALTVISQHRFDPGLVELKRLLDDGALGRLVLGEASTKWYRAQAYYDSAAWRGTYAMDGGSLMNQGVHYVDLLRWCMGPPVEVTAVCTTQAHQIEVEDTALADRQVRLGRRGHHPVQHRGLPRLPAAPGDHRDRGHGDGRGRPDRRPCARRGPWPGGTGFGRGPRPVGGRRPGRGGRGQPRRAARRPARRGRYRARARGQRPGRPRRARDRPRRVRVVPHRPPGEAGGPVTVVLSGFADEISPDPRAQLATLAAESITHLELRSAWSVNVADFTGEQLAAFRAAVEDAGVRRLRDRLPHRQDPGRRAAGSRAGPDAPRRRRRG